MIKLLGKRCIRLGIGTLRFNIMWGSLDSNSHVYHADQLEGQRFETKHGPCFAYNKLAVHKPSEGYRLWFYFPSGRCWNLDLYIDRRGL